MQRVYRGERAQRGRFREFYQCDIDVIGKDALSPRFDAEVPAVIAAVFERTGDRPFTIQLNHRKLMRGFFEAQGDRRANAVRGAARGRQAGQARRGRMCAHAGGRGLRCLPMTVDRILAFSQRALDRPRRCTGEARCARRRQCACSRKARRTARGAGSQ
jgi:histidyl-tRNA synthetase